MTDGHLLELAFLYRISTEMERRLGPAGTGVPYRGIGAVTNAGWMVVAGRA
jgi:hypothetical protein